MRKLRSDLDDPWVDAPPPKKSALRRLRDQIAPVCPGSFVACAARTFQDAGLLGDVQTGAVSAESDIQLVRLLSEHLLLKAMGDLVCLDRADEWGSFSADVVRDPLRIAQIRADRENDGGRYRTPSTWERAASVIARSMRPHPSAMMRSVATVGMGIHLAATCATWILTKSWYVTLPCVALLCTGAMTEGVLGDVFPEGAAGLLLFLLIAALASALACGLFLIFFVVSCMCAGLTDPDTGAEKKQKDGLSLVGAVRISLAYLALAGAIVSTVQTRTLVLGCMGLLTAGTVTAVCLQALSSFGDLHEGRMALVSEIISNHQRTRSRAKEEPFMALALAGAGIPTDDEHVQKQLTDLFNRAGGLNDVRLHG